MKAINIFLISGLLAVSSAFAEPVSESAIRELLVVTNTKNLLEGTKSQLDAMVAKGIEQGLNGKSPTPKQQQIITDMKNKMVALVQGLLSWEKMEPLYIRLYQESFTQEEVNGMLAFYKSPVGQAVVRKTPVVMQKSMLEMQKSLGEILPEMQKIQTEFIREMKEAGKAEKAN